MATVATVVTVAGWDCDHQPMTRPRRVPVPFRMRCTEHSERPQWPPKALASPPYRRCQESLGGAKKYAREHFAAAAAVISIFPSRPFRLKSWQTVSDGEHFRGRHLPGSFLTRCKIHNGGFCRSLAIFFLFSFRLCVCQTKLTIARRIHHLARQDCKIAIQKGRHNRG